MIVGTFWKGSGLGNQLHRYVMTRVLAKDKGVDFGMEYPENFKGKSFMNLDMGKPVIPGEYAFEGASPNQLPQGIEHYYIEPRLDNEDGVDIRTYDWTGVNKIKDNTKIDGEFQGERYFEHRKDEIREWLKVEPLEVPEDLCIIGFRGGEFAVVADLFLPPSYWYKAIDEMRKINPKMRFKVVTDDPRLAEQFFPDFEVSHEIGADWRSIRYTKYSIIANSSFYILPTLLNQNLKKVIAPKFWARRNLGYWALPYNEYKGWDYI